ncbi:MAG: hypothetical protein QOJ54_1920 [Aliidongia sp.]|jgi:hypothetical protein|nr:hypothetical protein [Aliidongia sp.]
MDMLKVSAAEFQRNIGRYQDLALSQEYRRLKRRDREVLCLDDFTDADIAALEASRPPAEAVEFDPELKR